MRIQPTTPGAPAQYTIIFINNAVLTPNASTITIRFDRHIRIPMVIDPRQVFIPASEVTGGGAPGQALNPNFSPLAEARVGGDGETDITINVPDMDQDPGTGAQGIAAGAIITVKFSISAGLSNPTEGGSEYTVAVLTGADLTEVARSSFAIPRTLEVLNRNSGSRNSQRTVVGRGFKNGTSVRVWLDRNNDGKMDRGESGLITATVDSDDTFAATFTVTVPPFQPGPNFINALDGANNVAGTPASFEVMGRVTVDPKQAVLGETILVNLFDFPPNFLVPGGVPG